MSLETVTARVQQIQSQLNQIAPPLPSALAAQFAGLLDHAVATPASFATTAQGLDAAGLAAAGIGTPQQAPTGGAAVVADARRYLGVPYVWGGTDPAKGLDCSGLVQRVYDDLGYQLPRVSADQATAGTEVAGGLAAARPGDLLAFGSPVHHIAIYAGDGTMIEAPRPGKDVQVSPVYETPTHIRRIIPDTAPVFGTSAAAPVAGLGPSLGIDPAGATAPVGQVPYAGLFQAAAARYDVPAKLLVAVARQESGFDPRAVSPAGARGLMQLMPGTAEGLGVTDSFDPAQSIDGAARMLGDLTRRFGSTELALAAYNAGPGAVLKYGGVPPYPETQNYVRSVLTEMRSA